MSPNGVGGNNVNWITEIVSGTTQLGTHLDALCHLQIGDRGYNGWTVSEIAEPWGTNRLGVETIPQIVTRGWLVDVVSARGAELSRGEVVSVGDVERALDGAEPEPGDAVLFHTGWGPRWGEPAAYLMGEPGPGMELAGWLADRGVALTGCDTWSYGPVPAENPLRPFEVPQSLNVRHGAFIGGEPRHIGPGSRRGKRLCSDTHPSRVERRYRRLGITDRFGLGGGGLI
ncbi:MAG: cyclase family protein [Actinobacteria bacterium]|nr:cyclase family protein [Actinomycetota bacterium]